MLSALAGPAASDEFVQFGVRRAGLTRGVLVRGAALGRHAFRELTEQESLIHVETPNFGRIHSCNANHTARIASTTKKSIASLPVNRHLKPVAAHVLVVRPSSTVVRRTTIVKPRSTATSPSSCAANGGLPRRLATFCRDSPWPREPTAAAALLFAVGRVTLMPSNILDRGSRDRLDRPPCV